MKSRLGRLVEGTLHGIVLKQEIVNVVISGKILNIIFYSVLIIHSNEM